MASLINKIHNFKQSLRLTILNSWYGAQNKMYKTSTQEIQNILEKNFPKAMTIMVDDKSGGCGAMFEIYIESSEFKNLSIPKQHKLVYKALEDQIKVIHGLRVVTKVI